MPSFESFKKSENSSKTHLNKRLNKPTNFLPAYDFSLIGALESDHEQILKLYDEVLKAANSRKFETLQLLLVEFATSFTNHIQVEDELLYGYLKTLASTRSHTEQRVVAEFSSEMKNISISVFSFLSQSPYIPVTDSTIDNFIEEFTQMGTLLQDRIKREEKNLYPIKTVAKW